ncbi:MAG: hypothetical protein J6C97_01930 [Clostridia bacterium]|nr:hypothetical protein [Clostridia bacterium]
MQIEKLISSLNSHTRYKRASLLKKLRKEIGEITPTKMVNPFVRSIYSFSNHSPSMMAYLAYKSNLGLIGIFDMESLEGYKEFEKGCRLFEIHSVLGTDVQVKAHIADTLGSNCGFMGIADKYVKSAGKFLKPYREAHHARVVALVDKINKKLKTLGTKLSFVKDVYVLSKYIRGGTITEKHVWLALSKKLISVYGKGEKLVDKLLGLIENLSQEDNELLLDITNPFYEYDLARILKINFTIEQKFSGSHKDVIEFANSIEALSLYELRFKTTMPIEEVISLVKKEGYDIFAFDPRIMDEENVAKTVQLCEEQEIIALPLEIIDFPRKKFDSCIQNQEILSKLEKNAWAIAGHELLVDKGEGGYKTLTDIEFKKRIEILAGVIRPQYFSEK